MSAWDRCSRCSLMRRDISRYRRKGRATDCTASDKRHRWTSVPRLSGTLTGSIASPLSALPMSSAFEHPALPPVKTETYTYVEHHFSCGNCGLHTPGHIDPAIGSGGNGWETKREARAALTAHLRKCRGAR